MKNEHQNGARARPIVLCVDDEVRVVESLALHLHRDYKVHTALSGADGLQKLKELGGAAVVVSDMRMPGMDGASFLKQVLHAFPETTRILLTGDPGRDTSVHAVNEGQIFRYLTKPCPPDQLKAAVEAGVMQHHTMRAERQVLQETLIGCIQALVDVLAITNPVAFGRANRIKRLVLALAESLGSSNFWQLEAAAMLSQLGYFSLPAETVEKLYYGERLTSEEQVLVSGAPEVTNRLLGHIPRLEPVLQILAAARAPTEKLRALGEGTVGLGGRLLSLALDYDAHIAQGASTDVVVQTLRANGERYGTEAIAHLAAHVGAGEATGDLRTIPLRHVAGGMIMMQDVYTHLGTLLVPRGFEVTESFLERMRNFGGSLLTEEVKVLVPAAGAVRSASDSRG